MTTMPSKPWQVVHGDFCGPFPSGHYLLVLMDEHSRFPEVEIIRSTSTTVTIDKLEKILFSRKRHQTQKDHTVLAKEEGEEEEGEIAAE